MACFRVGRRLNTACRGSGGRQLAERAAAGRGAVTAAAFPLLLPSWPDQHPACSLSLQGIHTLPPWAAAAPAMPTRRGGMRSKGAVGAPDARSAASALPW